MSELLPSSESRVVLPGTHRGVFGKQSLEEPHQACRTTRGWLIAINVSVKMHGQHVKICVLIASMPLVSRARRLQAESGPGLGWCNVKSSYAV